MEVPLINLLSDDDNVGKDRRGVGNLHAGPERVDLGRPMHMQRHRNNDHILDLTAAKIENLDIARRPSWRDGDQPFQELGRDDLSSDFARLPPEQERAMLDAFALHTAGRAVDPSPSMPVNASLTSDAPKVFILAECVDQITIIFPDICQTYLAQLYHTTAQTPDLLTEHILDHMPYPKVELAPNPLKRKRELDPDEEAANKYGGNARSINSDRAKLKLITAVLSGEFPSIPMVFINATLQTLRGLLYSAHLALDEAERTWDVANPPYNKLKTKRNAVFCNVELDLCGQYSELRIDDPEDVRDELVAARRIKATKDIAAAKQRQEALDEEANLLQAEIEGAMGECGCCYGDYPLNRMVYCDSDGEIHWFCRGCALRNAETEIGNSKHELKCMSVDGCTAGFSNEQKNIFLPEQTRIALDRLETEANLRLAGIENLASCPFCPYAAEYPLVEVDKEFRCSALECLKVTCRLCKQETHLPKSCEEHARDSGLSVRQQIEEAMSAALIRKCNKCGIPFIKDEGCNKMTCTNHGCRNTQCYICGESCDYSHFDNVRYGGTTTSSCTLFDNVHARHDAEVQQAEQKALAQARLDHPEFDEDLLKVKVSDEVQQAQKRRRAQRDEELRAQAVRYGWA